MVGICGFEGFDYNMPQTSQNSGTLVLKLTLGPFLTLSVRKGHKLKDWVLGSWLISRVKVDNKNNQHFIYFLKSKL